jgi:hypothetical protein
MKISYIALAVLALGPAVTGFGGDDQEAFDPFGRKRAIRDDAVPGYIELSDGSILPGHVHATRDTRLKIFDAQLERQREVPWNRIKQIQCDVEKEWMEDEWRFRENANDQKVFTGRQYPSRIYVHAVTLSDGRTIRGPLSTVVYLQCPGEKTRKFELHKRSKGGVGQDLRSLIYVRRIRLGPDALKEGEKRRREREEKMRKKTR